jgi:hypothetical protein
MDASLPQPTNSFKMDPCQLLSNEAIIFKPDCKLLSSFQGLIDPSNSVDSYAFYSTTSRVLIYIHSSGTDCDEVVEVIVEGIADEKGNFKPDKAVTFINGISENPPTLFYEELVAYALRMLVGSEDMTLDRSALRNALSWLHPSLHAAHPLLKKRHGIKQMSDLL